MKKLVLLLFLSGFGARAQNIPACDSLVIDCCYFDSLGPNTLTILVSNSSSVLFDYPGFVLFNNALDTIAKETVNYFGIGQWPQAHTMDIVGPLVLPFSGKLNLYTLFYTNLACSFPFSIADTATAIVSPEESLIRQVYPNPAVDEVTIETAGNLSTPMHMTLNDVYGRLVLSSDFVPGQFRFQVRDLPSGIYVLRLFAEGMEKGSVRLMVAER